MSDDGDEGGPANANAERDDLANIIAKVTDLLAAGQHVAPEILRELAARCEVQSDLGPMQAWPKWTRRQQVEGVMVGLARKHGDNRPFLALYMDMKAKKPEGKDLPLTAWSVLNTWLSEQNQRNNIPLPPWVCDYFQQASYEISVIRNSHGLESSAQVAAVPRALGFVDRNWNIFAGDMTRMREDTAAMVYDNEGAKGRAGEPRIEAIRDFLGVEDSRTARRYVARGRTRATVVPWLK